MGKCPKKIQNIWTIFIIGLVPKEKKFFIFFWEKSSMRRYNGSRGSLQKKGFFSHFGIYFLIGMSYIPNSFFNVTSYVRRTFWIYQTWSYDVWKIFQESVKKSFESKRSLCEVYLHSYPTSFSKWNLNFFTFPNLECVWRVVCS